MVKFDLCGIRMGYASEIACSIVPEGLKASAIWGRS